MARSRPSLLTFRTSGVTLLTLPARLAARIGPAGLPGVRSLVRAVLTGTFGEPAIDTGTSDVGLLGPNAVSWRIIREPAAIVGGVRGLLVQALHPLAVAGVADHSRYIEDPLGRLQATASWVTTSSYGSTAQAFAAARRVRDVHSHVVGTAFDGRPYRAADPHLLTWVSIALTSSFLDAHQRWAPRPLSGEEADRFVAEQSRLAALLDERVDLDDLERDSARLQALREGRAVLPMQQEGTLPRSVRGLAATLLAFDEELGVTDQGREIVSFLTHPPLPPLLRAAYASLLVGAVGSLPGRHRRRLGFSWPAPAAALGVAHTAGVVAALRIMSGTSPAAEFARMRQAAAERAAA